MIRLCIDATSFEIMPDLMLGGLSLVGHESGCKPGRHLKSILNLAATISHGTGHMVWGPCQVLDAEGHWPLLDCIEMGEL